MIEKTVRAEVAANEIIAAENLFRRDGFGERGRYFNS
jgi:hypothetical protein